MQLNLPDEVWITEKKNSVFCLFTQPEQSTKNTSGYFMVPYLIRSEANEISKISFLPLLNVSSAWRDLISDLHVSSVFKISLVSPCGLNRAHTPNFGLS